MRSPLHFTWLASLVATGVFGAQAWTARVDPAEHDHYARDVRELQVLDNRVNELVLLARQSRVTHYDELNATYRRVRALRERIATVPDYVTPEATATIRESLGQLQEAEKQKETDIETFQSRLSVLRNSLHFFPQAAAHATTGAPSETDPARVMALQTSVEAVLQYHLLPSADRRARAEQSLAAIGGATGDLGWLVIHAETILEGTQDVDELTDAILQAPTGQLAMALDQRYTEAFHAAIAQGERRQLLLFAAALLTMALAAASVIARLRRSAEALRTAGTELSRANEALQREKERERELNTLKSRFVSMTSHEFRTPLSVILSSNELLEAYGDRWSTEKKSHHFNKIRAAVLGLRELLNGILSIGSFDAGKQGCRPAPFDVDRNVAELIQAMELQPDEHRIHLELDGDFEGVELDERLVNHILQNLLSNALKYSPDGGRVLLRVARDGDDITFEVEDEGIGISRAELATLFESFQRGSNVGNIPGTGLGLTIVKRAVDEHGGAIEVESEEGKGTRFLVRLPARPGARQATRRPAA